jgi:hypothetical protein
MLHFKTNFQVMNMTNHWILHSPLWRSVHCVSGQWCLMSVRFHMSPRINVQFCYCSNHVTAAPSGCSHHYNSTSFYLSPLLHLLHCDGIESVLHDCSWYQSSASQAAKCCIWVIPHQISTAVHMITLIFSGILKCLHSFIFKLYKVFLSFINFFQSYLIFWFFGVPSTFLCFDSLQCL